MPSLMIVGHAINQKQLMQTRPATRQDSLPELMLVNQIKKNKTMTLKF